VNPSQRENSVRIEKELNTLRAKFFLLFIASRRRELGHDFFVSRAFKVNKIFGAAGGESFYAQALPFHERSEDLTGKVYALNRQNLSNRRRYAVSLINMAETMAKMGRRDEDRINESLQLFRQTAAEDAKNLEAEADIAEICRTIAGIWKILGDEKREIENLEKALESAEKVRRIDRQNVEVKNLLVAVGKALTGIYQKNGEREKAEIYRRKFEELTKAEKN